MRADHSTKTRSRYRELSRKVAADHSGSPGVRAAGLDAVTFVDVFEAMIERESAFRPKAVSKKGAKGLGQLKPGTASDLGVTDPFDPEANLNGSAKYLTDLMLEFGSTRLALAAYNAGPQRVRQYGGIPPFKETRAYVNWIARKAGIPREVEQSQKTSLAPLAMNDQQPLNGDVSVWEF